MLQNFNIKFLRVEREEAKNIQRISFYFKNSSDVFPGIFCPYTKNVYNIFACLFKSQEISFIYSYKSLKRNSTLLFRMKKTH